LTQRFSSSLDAGFFCAVGGFRPENIVHHTMNTNMSIAQPASTINSHMALFS